MQAHLNVNFFQALLTVYSLLLEQVRTAMISHLKVINYMQVAGGNLKQSSAAELSNLFTHICTQVHIQP